MSTVFIKVSIISLYIESHSFAINRYNKHQCIVNPGLKFQIPKLSLLVAEQWNWDVCVLCCHKDRKWFGPFKIYSLEPLLNWLNSCKHSRKLKFFFQNISDYHHTTLADLSAVLQRATAAATLNLTRCLFSGTSVPAICANWNQNRGSAINDVTLNAWEVRLEKIPELSTVSRFWNSITSQFQEYKNMVLPLLWKAI